MKSQHFCRPWVVFDAGNPDHRRWFGEFLQNRTWGLCPVRFTIGGREETTSIVGLMLNELVEYYTQQEFGNMKVDKAA
jgi:hypothetical protein